jgi:putative spermidine/putrescine transport system permease protein
VTPLARRLLGGFCAAVSVFLVAPTLVLVPMSFSSGRTLAFPPPGFSLRWYENLFGEPVWRFASLTSVRVAMLTAILATALGTAAAFGLERGRFGGRRVVNALILSPMIVPLIIVAIGMYAVFVGWGLLGSVAGLVIGHTVLALPLVVVNVVAGLRTMDRDLETASLSLGASPLRTFWHVTLPALLPGILAGALFAFITSWDEVVVAIFLTSPLVNTLPALMWEQVNTEIDPTVAAAANVLTVLTTTLLAGWVLLRHRVRDRATPGGEG